MSYQILTLLGQAFILLCDLHSVGFAFHEMHRYICSNKAKNQLFLSGYGEHDLTTRPLNSAAYNRYAQFSPNDFFALFSTVVPQDQEHEIPKTRSIICSHYNLYQFPAFIAFIRSFPEYPNHLLQIARRLKKDKNFHQLMSGVQGFEKHGFCAFVKDECAAFSLDDISLPCC